MKRSSVVPAKEESLRLHVDIGWIGCESGDFISEEDGRGVKVLADAVSNNASQLLNFFFSHFDDFLVVCNKEVISVQQQCKGSGLNSELTVKLVLVCVCVCV